MGRPRTDPTRPSTPERIVNSALQVFARDGFDGANLAEIAGGAGIKRPSLLYHFPNKEALYAAVVARSFARLAQVLSPPMTEPAPFPVQLERLVRVFAEDLAANPADANVMVREMLAKGGPGQAILLDQVIPLLQRVVQFMEGAGGPSIRPGLPIQAAILQVVAHILLQSAAQEPLRTALWGRPDPDRAWALTRSLFLVEEV